MYLSLEEYWNLAYTILRSYGGLAIKFSKDEDSIAFVVHMLITADKNYQGDKGASRSSFRFTYGKFAIMKLTTNYYKKDRNYITSENRAITSHSLQRWQRIKKQEQLRNEIFCAISQLKEEHQQWIKDKYYHGMTYKELSREYNKSVGCIKKNVKKGLDEMKNVMV